MRSIRVQRAKEPNGLYGGKAIAPLQSDVGPVLRCPHGTKLGLYGASIKRRLGLEKLSEFMEEIVCLSCMQQGRATWTQNGEL